MGNGWGGMNGELMVFNLLAIYWGTAGELMVFSGDSIGVQW